MGHLKKYPALSAIFWTQLRCNHVLCLQHGAHKESCVSAGLTSSIQMRHTTASVLFKTLESTLWMALCSRQNDLKNNGFYKHRIKGKRTNNDWLLHTYTGRKIGAKIHFSIHTEDEKLYCNVGDCKKRWLQFDCNKNKPKNKIMIISSVHCKN